VDEQAVLYQSRSVSIGVAQMTFGEKIWVTKTVSRCWATQSADSCIGMALAIGGVLMIGICVLIIYGLGLRESLIGAVCLVIGMGIVMVGLIQVLLSSQRWWVWLSLCGGGPHHKALAYTGASERQAAAIVRAANEAIRRSRSRWFSDPAGWLPPSQLVEEISRARPRQT
jgi:hypothetical protein